MHSNSDSHQARKADRDRAEAWDFLLNHRESEYEGDAVADLAEDFAAHRLAGEKAGLEKAAGIAISHSNYGHVEGNRRAFAIARDLEQRATAILAAGKGS